MASLRAQKKALRSSILALTKTLPRDYIRSQCTRGLLRLKTSIHPVERLVWISAERITRTLLEMPEFKRSESVSCYLSMGNEVDTSGIVREILQAGKHLFVPRIDKVSGSMQMLRVYDLEDYLTLPAGLWGIREPGLAYSSATLPRQNALDRDARLDLIVMPGVAFDKTCSRLGYGKGFYDRFIASYRALNIEPGDTSTTEKSRRRRTPFLVALALPEQVLEGKPDSSVPTGATDQKVNAIISSAFGEDMVLRASAIPE